MLFPPLQSWKIHWRVGGNTRSQLTGLEGALVLAGGGPECQAGESRVPGWGVQGARLVGPGCQAGGWGGPQYPVEVPSRPHVVVPSTPAPSPYPPTVPRTPNHLPGCPTAMLADRMSGWIVSRNQLSVIDNAGVINNAVVSNTLDRKRFRWFTINCPSRQGVNSYRLRGWDNQQRG